ncbi:BspA family leucine-rich repeat surface protein, partial [Neotamlana nanhaiensis]|uniref:BspA family leucine-rich repeat surface protein n=1 Tax=Neotamlana nanhaiensis TaxID=1382798 RepID=UPI0005CC4AA2
MLKKFIFCAVLCFSTHLFSQNFRSIWNTNNIESGSSTNNQITIPTNPSYTYNYTVDWGDGNTDTGITANITHDYAAPGIYTVEISGNFPAIYFNDENSSDKLKIIEILEWGSSIQWQTMESAFFGCENLNFDLIDAPNLSQVTTLEDMFRDCLSFNGIVNNWDVSTITNLSGLFDNCRIFNRPLDNWDTSSVTNMSRTFRSNYQFNEPLDNWNTAAVTTMENMFAGASRFNQNINNWVVNNVTNMFGTFSSTGSYNQPLNNWNVSKVTTTASMFYSSDFNQNINNWDVSHVTDMSRMFASSEFNQSLDNWVVSEVENMSAMFQRNRTFNQPLNSWDVSKVTNMSSMFDGYYWDQVYNYPLDAWDVSNVTDMSYMFRDNSAFNQDLSNWDVSSVTNMRGMFQESAVFNQDINIWNVSNVTNMSSMFQQAQVFNSPLNNWNISNVTNTSSMFYNAPVFNQPLNNWNTSSITNFQNMFALAVAFNQDISGWNTSAVTNMSGTFNSATAFNQNIGTWDMSAVNNLNNMLSNSGISQENYDNILIAWSAQTVNSGLGLGATGLQYCDALSQRQSLIDDDGWTISGDNVNCSYVLCTDITMPQAGDTATPANSDIRWNPAPNATGYYVSVRRENGATTQVIYNNEDVGNVVGIDFTNEFTAGDTVYVTVTPYNDEGPATGCPEISFMVVDSWVNSPDAFKLTYDTTLVNGTWTSPADQLRLLTQSGLTYNYNIDWGDGQYDNNVTTDITHTYLTPGIYTISIIGDFPAPRHREFHDSFKLLSIDQWGTQVWQSMQSGFAGCENMIYNATDIPNLTNVENMASMFIACDLFNGNINNWDVSNVTNMYGMFGAATAYNQPLDNWDVSNVTNMNFMFASTQDFNQNLNSWNTSSVTDMARMFSSARAFNQPLNNWNTSNVDDMSQMFSRASVFNQPLGNWDTSNVLDMEDMFYYAEAFNQNIDAWNVASVTTMESMFQNAIAFNQPLNSWNVASVTNMSSMFSNANAFNQPLGNWNVFSVANMYAMFSGAQSFNQNIDTWNVTNVTNMSYMFNYASNFNEALNSWDVNSVVNMSAMFRGAQSFNQPLNNWDVSAVANMSNMFQDAVVFNQPLSNWNVSSVTLMPSMFESASAFNQDINTWDVSVVTNFQSMFESASVFNSPLNNWDTGEALTMETMFYGASAYNQNIDSWNTAYVIIMKEMFRNATSFNYDLNSWNVASVTTMQGMFQNATAFNGVIDSWNVRNVLLMMDMFNGASSFNQSVNSWRTNNVTNMDRMFQNASSLNQPFNNWLIGNVSMRAMFHDAVAFNQYLGDWDISGVSNMQNMLDDTAISRENYDNTLIAWSEQTLTPGINLGANSLLYCDALEERQSMIDNFGWTISGDVLDCPIPDCTQLVAPLNGATNVPVNTNITWEHALYAREYDLTITIQPSGTVITETVVDATTYEFAIDFTGGETVYVTIVPKNDSGSAVGPCTQESFVISTNAAAAPDCTTITLPNNGDTDVPVTTDLSWDIISNADGYRLTVGTTSGGNDILNNVDVGNNTSYDFASDLPEDTLIYVNITPYNADGDSSGCTEASFRTEFVPIPPTCTTLTNPLNGATNVAVDTNLSWNAVADATGYLVSVGITSGGVEVVNSIDVGNVTIFSFSEDLQENRIYYVNITPYNAVGDASGCTEESFTTSAAPTGPSCTSLTQPLNGATNVSVSIDINWSAVADATGYRLTIGTTSGGNNIVNNIDVGNNLTYNYSADFPENTQIYVTITPYNAIGDATGCSEESFTTETLPTPPGCTSLTNPVNGATDVLITTDLSWNNVTDASGYRLTVGTTSGGNDILDNVDMGNVLTYDFASDLPENTEIFVTITPYNTDGDATDCSEESFTTETLPTPPGCTSLTNPLNGATDVAISTDLSWNTVTTSTGYRLTVGTTSGGNDILDNVDVGNVLTYDFASDLPENTEIFVTITPYNTDGDATGCSEESFTTETLPTPPGCASLTNPVNGASDVAITTDLSWNTVTDASGYRLTVGTTSGGNDILDNVDVGDVSTYDFASDLPENTEIFVTITPYNADGDATGCSEESFTTETLPTPPNCTSLINPVNGATDVAITTDLSWNTVTTSTGYRLTVGTTSGGNDILDNVDVGDVLTYNFPSDLPENTEVFVTITPYNADGDATGCSEESFTTETLPTPPNCTSLINPLNGATDVL